MMNISYQSAGLTAVLGYLVVFLGLILLMLMVLVLGRIMIWKRVKRRPAEPAAQIGRPAADAARPATTCSAGEVELFGTNPREAAIVMAIVANRLGKPLEELRFKSIKEVK